MNNCWRVFRKLDGPVPEASPSSAGERGAAPPPDRPLSLTLKDLKMDWTDEAIEILRAGYKLGLPSRQIAEQLGTTRNAVLGKGGRLNLVHPNATPSRPRKILPKTPIVKGSVCQYPHGDPDKPDFHFCEAPVFSSNSPYCKKHHNICYRVSSLHDKERRADLKYFKRSASIGSGRSKYN